MINNREQESLQKSAPIWLQRLVWQLSEEAADVLTFNYDLLFERAVMMLRRANAFSQMYFAPLTHRMRPGAGTMLSRSEAPARCPQHVGWGVDVPADGIYVPNVLVNGTAVERSQLPSPDELTGPDNWGPELLFARWVGTTWPDVTAQGLPSNRWPHSGCVGFARP